MTSNKKDPVLVVLQMTGAYDALNTFVPYSDPHYVDYRANLQIGPDQVLAVDDKVGFHPGMDQIKDMYDQGKVAVCKASVTPTPIVHISAPWTFGILPNRKRWPLTDGWARLFATSTQTKKTY